MTSYVSYALEYSASHGDNDGYELASDQASGDDADSITGSGAALSGLPPEFFESSDGITFPDAWSSDSESWGKAPGAADATIIDGVAGSGSSVIGSQDFLLNEHGSMEQFRDEWADLLRAANTEQNHLPAQLPVEMAAPVVFGRDPGAVIMDEPGFQLRANDVHGLPGASARQDWSNQVLNTALPANHTDIGQPLAPVESETSGSTAPDAGTLTFRSLIVAGTPPNGLPASSALASLYAFMDVCLISVSFDGTTTPARFGSGAIIGPHTILTASHVLWDNDLGQGATSVGVYPGYAQGGAPISGNLGQIHYFQVNDSTATTILTSFAVNDFAVIDVGTDLSQYGWFGHWENFTSGGVNVSGYPGLSGIQVTETGHANVDSQFQVLDYPTIAVPHGMSGGPLWVVDPATSMPAVVGLVSVGFDTRVGGFSPQLTSSNWQTIQAWVESDSWMWGDDYPNNTKTTGHVWVNSSPVTGNIETPHDRDWFAVQLVGGTSYRFNLDGAAFNAGTLTDPYVNVFDSSGSNVVASDTDSGAHGAETFYYAPQSGTYFVEATDSPQGGTGTYSLSVTPDDYASDANSSYDGMINNVANGKSSSTTGNIEVANDDDWFKVQLNPGTSYRINLDGADSGGGTLPDPYLHIYDHNSALVIDNDDVYPHRDSEVIFTTPSGANPLTYYVDASSWPYTGNQTGTYTVRVTQDDYGADVTNHGYISLKNGLAGSATGSIETAGDSDWFAVGLTPGTTYRFDVSGANVAGKGFTLTDPVVHLYDSSGNAITNTTGYNNEVYWTSSALTANSPFTYVAVSGYSASNTYDNNNNLISKADIGTYAVHVTKDDYASNQTTQGVVLLDSTLKGSANGSIEVAGDHDWFKVKLLAFDTYTFHLGGANSGTGTLASPTMSLYDSAAHLVEQAGASRGGGDPWMTFTPTASGTYYVDAGSITPTIALLQTATGTYHLDVQGIFSLNVSATQGQSFAASSANADASGGTLSVGDGMHMANIALLGSYMASTFVTASDGHGGTLISEAAQTSAQSPLLTQPHG
jgi:hypothetical protein